MNYETKDSGARQEYSSGMVRDITTGKPRFDLMVPEGCPFEETFLYRIAMLLERGSRKYSARNWEAANTAEERARFKESAFRHFMAWYCDQPDEDHGAAVFYNMNGAEEVKRKLLHGTDS